MNEYKDLIGTTLRKVDWPKHAKVGKQLRCLESRGWAAFEKEGVYTIVEIWGRNPNGPVGCTVDVNGRPHPISFTFAEDFELITEDESHDQ